MREFPSTDRSLRPDRPVPDAYVKLLGFSEFFKHHPSGAYEEGDTATIFHVRGEPSGAVHIPYTNDTRELSPKNIFGRAGGRLKQIVIPLFFSANIDITKLTTQPIFPDFNLIRQMKVTDQWAVLPPSPSLIMSRDQVLKSSLMTPSGALLAWLEMEISSEDK